MTPTAAPASTAPMLLRMFMFTIAFVRRFSRPGPATSSAPKVELEVVAGSKCEGHSIEVTCATQVIVCPWLCVRRTALLPPGIRGRQQLCESVVAGGDTALHAGFKDGVADLA